ncbi:hypothetical protein [Alienimonas sp. DA493]|uniref:hypothetical protein n=1 Tax=Alienimonas sp. DA493 TaxID=3373605 RepID=UPI003754F995
MNHLLKVAALSLGALAATSLSAGTAQAQVTDNDVRGDLTNRNGKVIGSFEGVFEVTEFTVEGNQLIANGTLSGDLLNKKGKVTRSISEDLSAPVQSLTMMDTNATATGTDRAAMAADSCMILDLDLGPLDLNLLGLVIDLEPIVLDIFAVPSDGALGSLLCALVGPDGLISDIAGLLEDLISANLLDSFLDFLNGLLEA